MTDTSLTIETILAPELSLCRMPASSKKRVMETIAEQIQQHDPSLSDTDIFNNLVARERLGSTGIGQGIAIPHCRSLVVNRLRVAFGRRATGVEYNAIDNQPVNNFFLIVAPPLEVSNQYLPVLGKLAQFAKDPEITRRLAELNSPDEFLSLLEEKAQ